MKNSRTDDATVSQIHKDIVRTYSHTRYFNNDSQKQGYAKLNRLLRAISGFEDIGYVQGMNFIAASILWHCDEDIAFYIIRELFIRLEAKFHYAGDLSGIQANINNFHYEYLKLQERNIYTCLEDKGIIPQMILPEWFVTLGISSVPLSYHTDLVYMLIKYGWGYLYSVIKDYLAALYEYFKDAEFGEAMNIIKSCKSRDNTKISFNWDKVLQLY